MSDKQDDQSQAHYPEPSYDDPGSSISSVRASRRQFIKGVIASGAAVTGAGALISCSSGGGDVSVGGVERMVRLMVNGVERTVDVLPNETLAMTLRYKLNLTGTKLGCDRGECGACTVLVDDVASYSCSMLTHSVRNQAIMTVEGLQAADGTLHPVQQAMIDELGPQCGFCTPGQIMSAVALLRVNPNPTRDQVRMALSGNLCRCGAYDNYTNAVMRAAQSAA
ncbi:MAG: (2Fe-2S)-binding protein [Gammaproteobacteria bacterium]|jgi:aerobic-type carbon monoxide dehydrogenase small subunit (CoxS/CutS family)